MSKYLIKTGDIKTIALLNALQCEDFLNKETLNQLKLWYVRCRFDVEKGIHTKESKNK